MVRILRHVGRFNGSRGSPVGMGTYCRSPSLYSRDEPSTTVYCVSVVPVLFRVLMDSMDFSRSAGRRWAAFSMSELEPLPGSEYRAMLSVCSSSQESCFSNDPCKQQAPLYRRRLMGGSKRGSGRAVCFEYEDGEEEGWLATLCRTQEAQPRWYIASATVESLNGTDSNSTFGPAKRGCRNTGFFVRKTKE